MHRRRMWAGWAAMGLWVGIVSAAGGAFACTNLATLNLSTSMGKPGDVITVTGSGFQASTDETPMDDMAMGELGKGATSTASSAALAVRSRVVLRWNGPDGPVLTDAIPDHGGTISVLFSIPQAKSGTYTVLAVQKNPQGVDVYGTPARAPIQIVTDGHPAAADVRGSGTAGAAGQSGSAGTLVLTMGLGLLGLGLLATGGVFAARTIGTPRSVPARVWPGPD